jgi:hypothetical protein
MEKGLLYLGNVTLLSANGSADSDLSLAALEISARQIRFASIKLLAASAPSRPIPSNIEFIAIPPMDLAGYNTFSVKRLVEYVGTDYVLTVQPDGFVVHRRCWQPVFLDYDYIGAPWPRKLCGAHPNHRVGNSGFCLRSHKFLEETSLLNFSRTFRDDILICRERRQKLESKGIRYAPPKVAAHFSVELPVPENPDADTRHAFGFHGMLTSRTRCLCRWLHNWNKRKHLRTDINH